MENIDYHDIVIKSYFLNKKYYKSHLIRESKKAEKLFVEKSEFFSRCQDVLNEEFEKFRNYKIEKKIDKDDIVQSSVFVNKELYLLKYFYSEPDLKFMLEIVNELFEEQKTQTENFKKIWFQVGLAFADGRIFDLHNEKFNYSEIAGRLFPNNVKGYRPYISSTFSGTQNDKNIFLQKKKMKEIIDYAKANFISIHPIFLEKYQSLKS